MWETSYDEHGRETSIASLWGVSACSTEVRPKDKLLQVCVAHSLSTYSLLYLFHLDVDMGVALNCREQNFNKLQGHTEELVQWISRVRCKKTTMKKSRRRNLRMEAILACALLKAESELKYKQQSRYKRWQLIKMELHKESASRDCSSTSEWDYKTCDDLNSLNSFMLRLNEVKITSQRWHIFYNQFQSLWLCYTN